MVDRARSPRSTIDAHDGTLLGLVDAGQQRVTAGDETGVEELPAGPGVKAWSGHGLTHEGRVVADDQSPCAVGPVLKGPEQGPGAQTVLCQEDLVPVDPDGGQAPRVGGEDLGVGRVRAAGVGPHPQAVAVDRGVIGRSHPGPVRAPEPEINLDNAHRNLPSQTF